MAEFEGIVADAVEQRLGDAVGTIALGNPVDAPVPTMTLDFDVYGFLTIVYSYVGGRSSFSVDWGSRLIEMKVDESKLQLSSPEDVYAMVEAFVEEARLWIPDEFLHAHGWGQ